MSQVKRKLRTSRKWGYLSEMLCECDGPRPFNGVGRNGCLYVNPALAVELSARRIVKHVRHEFRVAAELRNSVRGFL
jgi:hypothetical protein